MPWYLQHRIDCTEDGPCEMASHPSLLPDAPEGWTWTLAPGPGAWTATIIEPTGFEIMPRPRSEGYALLIGATEKTRAVDELFEAKRALGYPVPSGTMAGHILQIRESDVSNWLISLAVYSGQVDAGNGAVEMAEFRTMSNASFMLSFTDAVAMIKAMMAYGGDMMVRSWRLKNEIAAAPDLTTLEAIDITTGWP